jgi:hypothetical protein
MKLLTSVLPRQGGVFQGIVALLVVALVASLLFPLPVPGQLGLSLAAIVSLLQTIYDVIRDEIGKFLDEIRTLTRWFNEYYQLVLFPRKAIEAARAFADWMKHSFNELIAQALNRSVQSATLPAPRQLESLIRNSSLDFDQLGVAYRNVYGSIPAAADAAPLDRALIDVDDALALSSLKNLNTHDATVGMALNAASEIEDKIREPESAPGAAPFLSAAGITAAVQTQAMIQKMIAAQLRQEAALLAHRNALLKRDVVLASQMRENINNLVREK